MERLAPVEERRFERIKDLVGPPTLNAVYRVVAEDHLSQPIAELRSPPGRGHRRSPRPRPMPGRSTTPVAEPPSGQLTVKSAHSQNVPTGYGTELERFPLLRGLHTEFSD
ncbi:hypothetical protein ACFV1W_15820 [Kitasatospora sp. NPDC059648]|uniref:hypothetical protein n=1 Tax=Kitasatospora sp. NPDC059648 TaxID=3346894 RepID=UPI0036C56831